MDITKSDLDSVKEDAVKIRRIISNAIDSHLHPDICPDCGRRKDSDYHRDNCE